MPPGLEIVGQQLARDRLAQDRSQRKGRREPSQKLAADGKKLDAGHLLTLMVERFASAPAGTFEGVFDPEGHEPRRGRIVMVAVISVCAFLVLMLITAFLVALWYTGRMLRRQAVFWWQAGPILLAYRWSLRKQQLYGDVQDEKEQKLLDDLHEEYAPKALEIVQSMGGMFLKMAQVAANNPMIPMQYRKQFAKCCDRNIPMDFQNVRKEVEAALRAGRPAKLANRTLEDVFSRFDSDPVGVASIGQVHRAKIAKTGREVAIKVKFPDVEQLFMADFVSLKVLARVCRTSWAVPLIEEFSKQIAQEFNYHQEAANVETMSRVLMPKFEDKIEIPGICRDLTTDAVLTMTFVDGTRLDVALKQRLQSAGIDAARLEKAIMLEGTGGPGLLASAEGQLEEQGGAQPSASQAIQRSRVARLSERTSGLVLDCLLAGLRFKSRVDHCFKGLRAVTGRGASQTGSDAAEVLAQADVRAVLGLMLDLWGYSMLEVGTFHADPHPGNVLLQEGGRIGLLDYGQVKTLPPEVQKKVAELIMAVANKDKNGMIDSVQSLGFEMEAEAEDDATPTPAVSCAMSSETRQAPEVEFAESIFGGTVPTMKERLRVIRSIREAPSEMFFVIRVAVILRGVGFGLGHRVHLANSWKKYAKAHLDWCQREAAQEAADAADRAGSEASSTAEEEDKP